MSVKKSICMIMAHADDIEYSAGATFAKYIADGYRALYGVMSRCNSGWTVTAEEGGHYVPSLNIIPRRRLEAEAAAELFGAELYYGDLLENCYVQRDGTKLTVSFTGWPGSEDDVPRGVPFAVGQGTGLWPDSPVVEELADLLVEWEPEVVVGQQFQNKNPDHFCAAMILHTAYRIARAKVEIGPFWLPVSHRSDAEAFPPLAANRFVDVTGHEDTCLRALACHKSQGGWLPKSQDGMWGKWRKWGEIAGCRSAEGFLEIP
jgi:LmbE family N-acetylglucosaminyl deacetylase